MDSSLVIGIGGLVVGVLSIFASVVTVFLNHRTNIVRIRFGIVYEERFRVCKDLYSQLSRLKDSVEDFGSVQHSNTDPAAAYKEMHGRAEDLRKTIRQNVVIFPENIANQLDAAWRTIKDSLYVYIDSASPGLPHPTQAARNSAIAAIDQITTGIAPYIRSEYKLGTK